MASQTVEWMGYPHRAYAEALSEFGHPVELIQSQGWLLERAIPQTVYQDAMGCYPLFACRDWGRLEDDFSHLSERLVCLSFVTDPLGGFTLKHLEKACGQGFRPYKEHFVIDLDRFNHNTLPSNHARNVRKALRTVDIEICPPDEKNLAEWILLYDHLVQRHAIHGIARFSPQSFRRQFAVPGLTIFKASIQGETVGMVLWYSSGERVYYHLAAYNQRGYENDASFGVFMRAIEYFRQANLHWISLGAGAGLHHKTEDGLTRFKSGWATGVKTAYFCTRIFQPELYNDLVRQKGIEVTSYFPAYRQGEFS
jgi:hypothetical protein